MLIAIPLKNGNASEHFGRSDSVALRHVTDSGQVTNRGTTSRGVADCESIPRMLHDLRVDLVLARNIGHGARQRLAELGIELLAGWTAEEPDQIVAAYIAGEQPQGSGDCGHADHHHHHDDEHEHGHHRHRHRHRRHHRAHN